MVMMTTTTKMTERRIRGDVSEKKRVGPSMRKGTENPQTDAAAAHVQETV